MLLSFHPDGVGSHYRLQLQSDEQGINMIFQNFFLDFQHLFKCPKIQKNSLKSKHFFALESRDSLLNTASNIRRILLPLREFFLRLCFALV